MLAFFFLLLRLVHLDAWNAAAFVPGRRSVPLSLSLSGNQTAASGFGKPNSSLRFSSDFVAISFSLGVPPHRLT